MSDSSSEPTESASELFAAIDQGDAALVARLIAPRFFTLLEMVEDSDADESAALTAEVDDSPVLVAFTSDEHASCFAGSMPDLFEGEGDVPGFLIDGPHLLFHLPEEFGVLLNPESDDCYVLPPDLVRQVRSELGSESE